MVIIAMLYEGDLFFEFVCKRFDHLINKTYGTATANPAQARAHASAHAQRFVQGASLHIITRKQAPCGARGTVAQYGQRCSTT